MTRQKVRQALTARYQRNVSLDNPMTHTKVDKPLGPKLDLTLLPLTGPTSITTLMFVNLHRIVLYWLSAGILLTIMGRPRSVSSFLLMSPMLFYRRIMMAAQSSTSTLITRCPGIGHIIGKAALYMANAVPRHDGNTQSLSS